MATQDNDFTFVKFDIFADRIPAGSPGSPGDPISLIGVISEFNIYESLETPYLEADVVFTDSVKLTELMGFQGTERIDVVIDIAKSIKIKKKFITMSAAAEVDANEKTTVVTLKLVEEHAYISALSQVSRSFTGTPSDIIGSLTNGWLNKYLKYDQNNTNRAAQSAMRVVVPYWRPIETIKWICDRMSTTAGSPFFVYSTLKDDDIRLNSLQTLMLADPWNDQYTYSYSQAAANVDDASKGNSLFSISYWQKYTPIDVLTRAQNFAGGTDFDVLDLTSGTSIPFSLSGYQTAEEFYKEQDLINLTPSIALQRPKIVTSDGKLVDQYNTRGLSQIVASSSMGNVNGYHDEREDASRYALKIKAEAMRVFISADGAQMIVPGIPVALNELATVGGVVDVSIPTKTGADAGGKDTNKSGRWLMFNIGHKFSLGKYFANMELSRLGNTK